MTDNPPAYSADVPPMRSTGSYLPPPTVDQVHIFSRHEDIKGTITTSSSCHLFLFLCRNILHRPKCPVAKVASSQMQAKVTANAPCLLPYP